MRRHTRAFAERLGVVGLINVQYAIKNGVVYVLEVNPRGLPHGAVRFQDHGRAAGVARGGGDGGPDASRSWASRTTSSSPTSR